MKQASIELLRELTHAHGAPGSEQAVARIVRRELDGYEHGHDRLGSVISRPPAAGQGPLVLVTAHMDEVGFAVQLVTPEGFIQFVPLGNWWTHTLMAHRVRILTRDGNEIPGTVTSVPVHFLAASERDKLRAIDAMYIDVGAADRDEAVDDFGIRPGDPIVPDADLVPMHNPDRLMAKAFDDRVGVALLIQCLQQADPAALPNRLVGACTVQEELGSRGAQTAAQVLQPDVALVLEGPPADDGPGFARDSAQGRLGGGVQIRVSDPTALMNRPLVEHVRSVAESAGIPHQLSVRRAGGTDARVIQVTGPGTPTVVLGVPARYIHSHNSILDLNDYLAARELLHRLLPTLDAETVDGFSTVT